MTLLRTRTPPPGEKWGGVNRAGWRPAVTHELRYPLVRFRRLRDAGRAAGGDHLGSARHSRQAGKRTAPSLPASQKSDAICVDAVIDFCAVASRWACWTWTATTTPCWPSSTRPWRRDLSARAPATSSCRPRRPRSSSRNSRYAIADSRSPVPCRAGQWRTLPRRPQEYFPRHERVAPKLNWEMEQLGYPAAKLEISRWRELSAGRRSPLSSARTEKPPARWAQSYGGGGGSGSSSAIRRDRDAQAITKIRSDPDFELPFLCIEDDHRKPSLYMTPPLPAPLCHDYIAGPNFWKTSGSCGRWLRRA